MRTLRQRGVDEVAAEALKKLDESKAQSPVSVVRATLNIFR